MNKAKPVRVAVFDLYNGEVNQGMRCIQDQLFELDCKFEEVPVVYDIFESRLKGDIPDDSYDIYISSGGPGSPFDDEGKSWETEYFKRVEKNWEHNLKGTGSKKYMFFICHSFQIMARVFNLGDVVQRRKKSFGILPFDITEHGASDVVFGNLPNPFYGADFRSWQVINPNEKAFSDLGAKILSIENSEIVKHHTKAMMAIRLSNEFLGTQFHPEADPASMYYHFRQEERKEMVVAEYGEKKYYQMIYQLERPENITLTRKTVLPTFLSKAIQELRPEHAKQLYFY